MLCNDLGFINTQKGRYTFAEECECLTKLKADGRKQRLLKNMLLPFELSTNTFKSFKLDLNSQEVFNKIKSFTKDSEKKNLLLYSSHYGCGKSHLAVAVLLDLYEKKNCAYLNMPRFFNALKSEGFKEMDDKKDALKSADLIVLDDLTASNPADWKLEFYYEILDERFNQKTSTIITANIKKPVELAQFLGGPAFDRFMGNALDVYFPPTIKSYRFNQEG